MEQININYKKIKQMKKLFLLVVLACSLSLSAQSKVVNLKSTTTQKTLDTVTNTGSRTQRLDIKGYNDVLTVQVIHKIQILNKIHVLLD